MALGPVPASVSRVRCEDRMLSTGQPPQGSQREVWSPETPGSFSQLCLVARPIPCSSQGTVLKPQSKELVAAWPHCSPPCHVVMVPMGAGLSMCPWPRWHLRAGQGVQDMKVSLVAMGAGPRVLQRSHPAGMGVGPHVPSIVL